MRSPIVIEIVRATGPTSGGDADGSWRRTLTASLRLRMAMGRRGEGVELREQGGYPPASLLLGILCGAPRENDELLERLRAFLRRPAPVDGLASIDRIVLASSHRLAPGALPEELHGATSVVVPPHHDVGGAAPGALRTPAFWLGIDELAAVVQSRVDTIRCAMAALPAVDGVGEKGNDGSNLPDAGEGSARERNGVDGVSTGRRGEPTIYIIADGVDTAEASAVADHLAARGVAAIMGTTDENPTHRRRHHFETLAACDGALIVAARAGRTWVEMKCLELRKAAGYGRADPLPALLCLFDDRALGPVAAEISLLRWSDENREAVLDRFVRDIATTATRVERTTTNL